MVYATGAINERGPTTRMVDFWLKGMLTLGIAGAEKQVPRIDLKVDYERPYHNRNEN